ncbi:MAG: WD40-like beta Propeller containing protein, partial [Gemmatimonadetes bacterium]|nr:WD40-like beta Propeller containing protein [Gemmatimonadota bacterium]
SWLTEGLAVYEESRLTSGGRLNDSEHEMLARSRALEGRFPRLDELSLNTSQFPAGENAYAFGSLFVEQLARARGDSTVRRFVDAQSDQLIPLWLDRAARQGFGVSFSSAYARWRDSVQRGAGPRTAPLPGWRELTTHGYYASSPRWLNDTTLIYTGTDGRETNAAYLLTTGGRRLRLGRRDARGANVPLARGGLLFAQLDRTSRAEVRSDLYLSRRGRVTRLTHGQRLIQPDARADGAIVAVELGPTRSSLVLLDSLARNPRVLRAADADETWSEPRWSPDGARIAVAHRRHGGLYSIEVIDVGSDSATTIAEGTYLLSAPSWSRDGALLLYVSEAEGVPQIASKPSRAAPNVGEIFVSASQTGLDSPEISPDAEMLAAVSLRADGYHIGIARAHGLQARARAAAPTRIAREVAPEPEAAGAFTRYSPWSSLLPRYWYPVIEAAPARGTRLGATTTGTDDAGRHAYSAYLAIPTTGIYPVGALAYRYAGLRQPLFDLNASQDYVAERDLLSGGTSQIVGTLLKRTRDASLAAAFVRPRARTSASVSVGAGVERRSFVTDPGEFLAQLDTVYAGSYTFPRLFVGATWSNLQRPPLSISQEDGVALALTVRDRWRTDLTATTRSVSAIGTAAMFKSLPFGGFAHHVLALRLSGGIADRRAATSLEVGGTSGTTLELLPGYTVGEGRRTFGVRGFPAASTYGTRAAAAALEYRAPLVLASRGLGMLPLFLDRSALTLFADAGVAACPENPLYFSTCAPALRPPTPTAGEDVPSGVRVGKPIGSVGAELSLGLSVLSWDDPQTVRIGIAAPVLNRATTRANAASPYVAFGFSF